MRRVLFGLLCLAAVGACGGCYRQPYYTPERLDQGLVVVLPGIEGRSPLNQSIVQGLVDAGVPYGIDNEDWTSWLGPLYNQRAEIRNRRKANQIAVRVAEYKYAHPGKPVILIGQSGGGAMALWIAEAMPEGQEIDGAILLAPAISPGYMLADDIALTKTKRGIVNFYSSRDWFFLGVGTTVVGTMDGKHASSAGRVGFDVPADAGPIYNRLFQVPWHKQMAAAGNEGGHLSSSAEAFVADYVAPLVMAPTWSDSLIAQVIARKVPAKK